MKFFGTTNINFIGNRKIALAISAVAILVTIASLGMKKGPNFSIDFLGGTVLQLKFEKPIAEDRAKIQEIVAGLNFGVPEVKVIGNEGENELQIIVKRQTEGTKVGKDIKDAISEKYSENAFELRSEDMVGPRIGNELKRNAVWAIVLSLLVIVVYIGIRFHFPFGVAAIVALFHDVVITIGVFSLLNWEISLPIIAALLTIVGYSLNDTIVVFDRIRENLGGNSKKSFEDRVNESINQSLSRTIITSVTTFMVVASIFGFFFKSGDVIELFSAALLTGIIVGTYSSMFIASPVLVAWNKKWAIK